MGCLGVHFAIPDEVASRLISAGDDEELVEIVQEEIEETSDEKHTCETDKAWDALHRCLSNGKLGELSPEERQKVHPLNLCFFGGQTLNEDDDYFVVLLKPDEVKEVATALKNVSEEWLRDRYFSLEFPQYQGEKGEEDFEYSWTWFKGLPAFFSNAAAENLHVIFTVDQ